MTAQGTFSYRARDGSGQVVTGTMLATSAQEVGARLRAEGKFILAVDEGVMRGGPALAASEIRRHEWARRVRRDDVIAFSQQLSVMLETGVPLSDALDSFCRQVRQREFRQVLSVLRDDICGGEPFSKAMAKWPRVFPHMMVSLMKASEASGTMSMMLARVGEYLAKERRTIRQIRTALTYPLFMMVSGLAITVFLMAFVLPRFGRIYEGRGADLPAPTQILLDISHFITGQYMIYGPVMAGLAVAFLYWRTTGAGRRTLDWLKLHAPVLRTLFGQLYLTRAARTMATLLTAGVNLLDIIDICRGVTRNVYYDGLWASMEHGVREGRQLSEAFAACRFIPPNVASMIASGEKSGRLAHVMERIAEFAEQELDGAVKQTTAFIEPLMIIIMGAVIGLIAVALLMPIFSMGRVMSGG
jgi:type IV pilus assembly protein PilC